MPDTLRLLHRIFHKNLMVFSNNFLERVPHSIQEVFVGGLNVTLQVKLNDCLRFTDRVQLAFVAGGL